MMSIITWKESYATGINAMDNEHQKLIAQINLLYSAIRDKQADSVIAEVLSTLEQYTIEHFQHEEKLMSDYQYPDLQEHKVKHQDLIGSLQQIKEQENLKTDERAKELMRFLRSWLMSHIIGTDKAYGPFLESRGGRFIK